MEGKTSAMGKFFSKAIPSGRILMVLEAKSDLVKRRGGNIRRVSVVDVRELNPGLMHAKHFVDERRLAGARGSRAAGPSAAAGHGDERVPQG